jgi:3-isopropylmalate/(R)-2-methylmalate dehydratase small subunit
MAIERIRSIAGTALPLPGDNIDTDRIIPARFLRSVTFEGLEDHLFEDDRLQADEHAPGTHPLSRPQFAGATILLVNANFGCGSSREHAPQAIRRRGFRAIVGQSYSEIFFGNAVALGMPCVTTSAETMSELMAMVEAEPAVELAIDLEATQVTAGGKRFAVTLPQAARESFLEGTWDATGLLLDRYADVEATASRLPYLNWA